MAIKPAAVAKSQKEGIFSSFTWARWVAFMSIWQDCRNRKDERIPLHPDELKDLIAVFSGSRLGL